MKDDEMGGESGMHDEKRTASKVVVWELKRKGRILRCKDMWQNIIKV
jgi:hypothetical protein